MIGLRTFLFLSALTLSPLTFAQDYSRIEKEIDEASGPNPVKESLNSAQRIKQAQMRLAYYKAQAEQAQHAQKVRYQKQLEEDRKADAQIQKINSQTKKYQKDLAIAEFNQKRSEIALAYAKAKVARQKKHQQKVYQRKIAVERADRQ